MLKRKLSLHFKLLLCTCFWLIVTQNTHALDAAYNPSTNILTIPALQINDNLINVSLSLGTDGCFTIQSTSAATLPYTGATYNPATLTAILPTVAVGQNIFQANIQFLNGCFRATNIIDVSNQGQTGGQLICPNYRVGDIQTFTTTIETTSLSGTTVSSSDSIGTVSSSDGSMAVLDFKTVEDDGSLRDDHTETIQISGGQRIFVEAFTHTSNATGFITRQISQFPECPIPAVGTVYTIDFLDQQGTQVTSTMTRTINTIVPNITVSTLAGDFVTTRVDSTLEQNVSGTTLPSGELITFYADSIGIVRQISINEINGFRSVAIQELTSSNF